MQQPSKWSSICKKLWKKRRKEDKKEGDTLEEDDKETPFYKGTEYGIRFHKDAYVISGNVETCFSITPDTFKQFKNSFGRMQYSNEAKRLMKEYNVTINDCGTPGLETKLACEHLLRICKTPRVERLYFIMYFVPDMRSWQQENLDHGIPENVEVDYLNIHIPAGLNPRLHERFNYEHLYFFQYYSRKEERIHQTVNEKMLKAKLLALTCFVKNPEALSRFEGWGLLVNFASENNLNKSFIEEVIDSWIEINPVRRLTGLFDRHARFDDGCPERIMSTEEKEAILEKLSSTSSKFVKEEMNVAYYDYGKFVKTRIRFTRKTDGAEGDLYIYMESSNCVGMAFIQPPDKDAEYFLTEIYSC